MLGENSCPMIPAPLLGEGLEASCPFAELHDAIRGLTLWSEVLATEISWKAPDFWKPRYDGACAKQLSKNRCSKKPCMRLALLRNFCMHAWPRCVTGYHGISCYLETPK